VRLDALLDHPLVGHVRSVGLLGGLELVADKASRRSFTQDAHVNALVAEEMLQRGVIVRPVSGGDCIAVSPALTVCEAQIDQIFDALIESLDQVEKIVSANRLREAGG
jgi:4-aminobutyrate--pyruvate transaminase